MRLHNLAIAMAIVSLVGAFTATPARADQIGISGGTGSITFTNTGSGTLSFSTAGFTIGSGLATFQSPNGTVVLTGGGSFSAMSGTTFAESGGVFLINTQSGETFTFTSGGNSVTVSMNWVGIKDDTSSPQFDVNTHYTVTSVSGTNAAFLADFALGSTGEIDFTVSNSAGVTLSSLAAGTLNSQATFNFSSGQLVPAPEASTLAMLAMGLLAVGLAGAFFRRENLCAA